MKRFIFWVNSVNISMTMRYLLSSNKRGTVGVIFCYGGLSHRIIVAMKMAILLLLVYDFTRGLS